MLLHSPLEALPNVPSRGSTKLRSPSAQALSQNVTVLVPEPCPRMLKVDKPYLDLKSRLSNSPQPLNGVNKDIILQCNQCIIVNSILFSIIPI